MPQGITLQVLPQPFNECMTCSPHILNSHCALTLGRQVDPVLQHLLTLRAEKKIVHHHTVVLRSSPKVLHPRGLPKPEWARSCKVG